MAAPSKRARITRKKEEFDISRLMALLEPPPHSAYGQAWKLENILSARNAQQAGLFDSAALMAEGMRADDALFVAKENRLAPQRCTKVQIVPAKGARGRAIAGEADGLFGQKGVALAPNTLRDINAHLVDHGVAFAYVRYTTRPDGSRVDCTVSSWPIRFVRWYATEGVFKTIVQGAPDEVITHGDGRWIIFQEGENEPFKNGAIIAAAMVWARHAFPLRDWMQGSLAHGSAKVVGEMPAGVALQDANGLTKEAQDFMALLKAMSRTALPYGLRPAGAKTEFVSNNSTAWQVWNELVGNAEKAAARIYLGTDGTLGSNGGAPGVDISQLFGVALTKVQGDLATIERGLREGVIEPWCAINFGDSTSAPDREYILPDADADAARESTAKRRQAFYADLKAAREASIDITQEFVNELAAIYDVDAPQLKATAAPAQTNGVNGSAKPVPAVITPAS